MASLAKRVQTRWYKGDQRVPAGTPGAKKVLEKSDHWYIVYRDDAGRVRREKAYTDKSASEAKLAEWLRAKERGQAGLTDPYKAHLDKPISEHVADYLQHLTDQGASEEHLIATKNRLKRVIDGIGAKCLRDVTAPKVTQFLRTMTDARPKGGSKPVSLTTKNDRRSALYSFCKWLVLQDRMPRNPIDQVPRLKPQKGTEATKRVRRALKRKELHTILIVARELPVRAASTNTGGRPRKDGSRPEPRPVELTKERRADLERAGEEMQLRYLLALFTGLRRGELSRIKVRHFKPQKAILELPGAITKNGRSALIPLVPGLVERLRGWVKGKKPDDKLIHVPCRGNLLRSHKAVLSAAGVPYTDEAGRVADWHALRKTLNMFLKRRKVDGDLMRRMLRHAIPSSDVNATNYTDETLAELKPVVHQLTKLWRYLHA